MIDSDTLARLIAVGRRKGHLTNQDLEVVLPVNAMSVEDIALVVVHLEDAGVPVELDDSLLGPASLGGPPQSRPAEILLPANDIGSPAQRVSSQMLSATEGTSSPHALKAGRWSGPSAHKAVLFSIILILLLAFLALALGS